ncbi:MAG: hypothetical protein HY369_00465 [Candidatus Aenigmarchaeota archaeon]|nr:hypothetical protein [Candidatus Aenigmarchaeota archaeon]
MQIEILSAHDAFKFLTVCFRALSGVHGHFGREGIALRYDGLFRQMERLVSFTPAEIEVGGEKREPTAGDVLAGYRALDREGACAEVAIFLEEFGVVPYPLAGALVLWREIIAAAERHGNQRLSKTFQNGLEKLFEIQKGGKEGGRS